MQVFGRRHDGRRLALRRPTSKKRQGTKLRDVGERLGSEGYGDLMLAPSSLAGATLGRGDLHAWTRGGRERENGVSAGAWSVSTVAGCIDRGESCRERSPPAWSQRNGTGKGRRSEEVWLMTCRLCLVSGATSAGGRMRTPRSRSCGCRNAGMGRAAGAAHPARYPTAVVGRRQARRHRGMRGPWRCCGRVCRFSAGSRGVQRARKRKQRTSKSRDGDAPLCSFIREL